MDLSLGRWHMLLFMRTTLTHGGKMTKRNKTDIPALIELLKDLKAEAKTLGLPLSMIANVSELRKTITAVQNKRKKLEGNS